MPQWCCHSEVNVCEELLQSIKACSYMETPVSNLQCQTKMLCSSNSKATKKFTSMQVFIKVDKKLIEKSLYHNEKQITSLTPNLSVIKVSIKINSGTEGI